MRQRVGLPVPGAIDQLCPVAAGVGLAGGMGREGAPYPGGSRLVSEEGSPVKRDEDQEQTLIFVDMLGFAALIEKHPCRIEDAPPTALSTC